MPDRLVRYPRPPSRSSAPSRPALLLPARPARLLTPPSYRT